MRKVFVVLAMISILFAGCAKDKEEASRSPLSETIKIGLAIPLTGGAAAYGEMVKGGVDIMLEQINKAGGVNGRQVEIVLGDDLCDPKEAAIVAQKFASNQEIVAVVGHLCSSSTLAGKPIYQKAGLVAVSPCSTAVNVCEGSDYMFRTVYRDDFQGIFNARYIKNVLGFEKVAIFYDNDDYGIGLKDAFLDEAGEIGLMVVAMEAYTKETTDFTPQLTKFKSLDAQALFIAGLYNEAAIIASQALKAGVRLPITGADGIATPGFIEVAGAKAAEGAIASSPFAFGERGLNGRADRFADAFIAKTGKEADWMAATSYDALGVLIAAIKSAGANRQAIKDYLKGMDSLEKGYDGLTGVTYFDTNGDCQKPAFAVTVKNGKWVMASNQLK